MPRFVAFLRAINVGGHTVRMERLRDLFIEMGFSDVETFIASGNVIFNARATKLWLLERKIERALAEVLGYEVATFVRTDAEVAAIADYQAFTPRDVAAAGALNVALLAAELDDRARARLRPLETDIDMFHAHGRELYWLCRRKQSESTFSNVLFERVTGVKATFRGISTIRKLAAKYGDAASAQNVT